MEQKEDEESLRHLGEHDTQQMGFYLENSLLLLAEEIAQEQRDLNTLQDLQYKTLVLKQEGG